MVGTIIPPLMLAVAGVGLWRARRQRELLFYLALLMILFLPVSSVFIGARVETSQGSLVVPSGYARRVLPMVVFLSVFVAWGLQGIGEYVRRRWLAVLVLAPLVALMCGQNMQMYFRDFADPDHQRWEFCREISDASRFMAQLPAGSYVYYYSDRWPLEYEVRAFLAPDARGENRSLRFGGEQGAGLETDPGRGRPVFILLDSFKSLADQIVARYPGSRVVSGDASIDATFIAVLPP